MRFSLFAGLWLASFAASTLPGQAPDAPAIDFSQLGPRVGQSPPDFSLIDQRGASRTLKSILRPNGAVLVFYRSAEW